MNIFIRELKNYRKSMLVWVVVLSALVIVFMSMFPAFTKDVAASQKVIDSFPAALRVALGISLKNFFTVYGFFAYLFSFAALAGAVQAMNLGVGVLSKEISGKTADFLLSKPVSRVKVMTSKLLAIFSVLLITNIVFSITTLIAASMVTNHADFNAGILLLISGSLLLIQLFFMALGVFLSTIIPKVKSVIAVSLPTVFIFYIIGTLGAILGNNTVRYLSPFKFYDPTYIINNREYEIKFIIIEAVFMAIAILASYIIFIKKDVHAAA
jgi:ABC-2 type transport system permease protein